MRSVKILKKMRLGNKGIAYVEIIFLIPVLVMFFGLTIGLWSSIHSGTLRSIAARHYAFEVLNNRTEFVYHRDTPKQNGKADNGLKQYYEKNGYRAFANVKHQPVKPISTPAQNWLNLFEWTKSADEVKVETNPKPTSSGCQKTGPVLKLNIAYGICLDAKCGAQNSGNQRNGFGEQSCRTEP